MRDTASVLRALNARTRREILELIWDRELSAGDIAAAFELSAPTISQHLAILREAGLVEMTARGTSRLYRARPKALDGLEGALDGALKWVPANRLPERHLSSSRVVQAVVAEVTVPVSQELTFQAFLDQDLYSTWMGVPVRIRDGRFAATMEWGTEVRGRYELVSPPELIVLSWNFEDDNVPVPGRDMTGYLRVRRVNARSSRVEVHQLVEDTEQAQFMQLAWEVVLGRLKDGLVEALGPAAKPTSRPRRPKIV